MAFVFSVSDYLCGSVPHNGSRFSQKGVFSVEQGSESEQMYINYHHLYTSESVLMALSIKNDEVERLTRTMAEQTGESLTQVILTALRDRWERLSGRRDAPDLREEVQRIQARMARLPRLDNRTDEEILGYDPDGVPH